MIPLLMEKLAWPPPGAMGPIFSEYLFVRFFARSGETAGDDRYWPTAKFQELLMQLRYTHAPDATLIKSRKPIKFSILRPFVHNFCLLLFIRW